MNKKKKLLIMSHYLRVIDLKANMKCDQVFDYKLSKNKIILSNHKKIFRHFFLIDSDLYNYHTIIKIYFIWD